MGYKTGKIIILFVTASLLILSSSCRMRHKRTAVSLFSTATAKFSEDNFASALKTVFDKSPFDTVLKSKDLNVGKRMRYIYSAYEFLPLWLNENGNTDAVEKF